MGSSGASGAEEEEGSSGASGSEEEEGSSGASGAEDEEEGSSGASGSEEEEGSSGASGAEDEEEGSSGASGPNGDTVTTGESEAEEAKRCNEGISKSEKKFCKLHKESKKTCESGGRGRCVWHKKSCKPRCPPKQLLYRCRVDGATPDGCCNFKPPYDHPLYRKSNVYQGIVEKKASSDLVCCNRDIGMWMPTHLKHESDKFCTSDLNEKRSEEDINAVADAASKFKAALGSLQEIKDAAVQDFREQYRANEATEALGDDKNAKLRVQVDTERQSVEGQQTQVELNKALFERLTQEMHNETISSEAKVEELSQQLDVLLNSTRDANVEINKKKAEEAELLEALAACNSTSKKVKSKLAEVRKALENAELKLQIANRLLEEKADEKEKLERKQKKRNKGSKTSSLRSFKKEKYSEESLMSPKKQSEKRRLNLRRPTKSLLLL